MLVFERTAMLKMLTAFQISSPKLLCSTNDSKRKAQKATVVTQLTNDIKIELMQNCGSDLSIK